MRAFIFALLLCSQAHAESLSVHLVGITAHGTAVSKAAADEMKNKLDESGVFALNRQFTLTYRQGRVFYTSALIDDCFKKPVVMLGYGRTLWESGSHTLDASLVLYMRERADYFAAPDVTEQGNLMLLPLPFVSYTHSLPLPENFFFESRISGNVFINHLSFGLRKEF